MNVWPLTMHCFLSIPFLLLANQEGRGLKLRLKSPAGNDNWTPWPAVAET